MNGNASLKTIHIRVGTNAYNLSKMTTKWSNSVLNPTRLSAFPNRRSQVSHQVNIVTSNVEKRQQDRSIMNENQKKEKRKHHQENLQPVRSSVHSSEAMTTEIDVRHKSGQILMRDDHGLIGDHHRYPKKKQTLSQYLPTCLGVTGVSILIIIMSVAVVLTVLFAKPSSVSLRQVSTRDGAYLRWNTTGVTIAGRGSGNNMTNSLLRPVGLAWDDSNTLFIAEYDGNRITKWVPGATSGSVVVGSPSGVNGASAHLLDKPADILLESNGDLYIVDSRNQRLQYWRNGAPNATTLLGSASIPSFSLHNPYGMARDPNSNTIYVSSASNHSVVSYPGRSIVAGGNGPGNTNLTLNIPAGIVYDTFSNNLIIANQQGHSIVRWIAGAASGSLIAGTPGIAGSSSTALNTPLGVVMDPMGNIYVADLANHRIQLFMNGEFVGRTIAGMTGVNGSNATLLNSPVWLRLDNQLNLIVADTYNNRVQKFFRY